jgi:hypothetical protein
MKRRTELAANDKAVVAKESDLPAIFTGDTQRIQALIQRNLGGAQIGPNDLTRIKMPAGGSTTWEIPSLRGDIATKELKVVLVYTGGRRAWWEDQYSGSSSKPPTCFSNDLIHGSREREYTEDGIPIFGTCDDCHYAQWGTKRAQTGETRNGQDCKSVRGVYFMSEYSKLPMWIAFPPTSLVPWKKYLLGLAAEELDYTEVVTSIKLESAKNDVGSFATPVLGVAGELSDDEKQQARALSEWLEPYLHNTTAAQVVMASDD